MNVCKTLLSSVCSMSISAFTGNRRKVLLFAVLLWDRERVLGAETLETSAAGLQEAGEGLVEARASAT